MSAKSIFLRLAAVLAFCCLVGAAPAMAENAAVTTSLQAPLRNFKAGFTLSIDPTTPSTVVDVAAGQAADSTNAALLSNPSAGNVNLASSGAGGLDTGSVAASTWYAIYEIFGPGGYGAIASAPAVISTTGAITSASTTLGTANGTNITASSAISVQGAGPSGTNLSTTVSGSPTAVSVTPSATTANSSNSVTSVSPTTSIIAGLAINDSTGKNCIPAGTVIASISGSTITLSQNTNSSGCGSGDTLTITGDNVTLATTASTTVGETGGTTNNVTVAVWGVSSISGRPPMSPLLPSGYSYYRYIGSVKTNGSSQILPFTQREDVYKWVTIPTDLNAVNEPLGSRIMETLSVPLGVVVFPNFMLAQSAGAGLITDPAGPDLTPAAASSSNPGVMTSLAPYPGSDMIATNTAGQIGIRGQTGQTDTVSVFTYGWRETWGRGN